LLCYLIEGDGGEREGGKERREGARERQRRGEETEAEAKTVNSLMNSAVNTGYHSGAAYVFDNRN